MRKFKYAKLVRDEIVSQIISNGSKPKYRVLEEKEYLKELINKLLEETDELTGEPDKQKLLEELADLQEILENLIIALDSNMDEVSSLRDKKKQKVGGFKKRHYIDYVEASKSDKWLEYYLENPEKYPEIK